MSHPHSPRATTPSHRRTGTLMGAALVSALVVGGVVLTHQSSTHAAAAVPANYKAVAVTSGTLRTDETVNGSVVLSNVIEVLHRIEGQTSSSIGAGNGSSSSGGSAGNGAAAGATSGTTSARTATAAATNQTTPGRGSNGFPGGGGNAGGNGGNGAGSGGTTSCGTTPSSVPGTSTTVPGATTTTTGRGPGGPGGPPFTTSTTTSTTTPDTTTVGSSVPASSTPSSTSPGTTFPGTTFPSTTTPSTGPATTGTGGPTFPSTSQPTTTTCVPTTQPATSVPTSTTPGGNGGNGNGGGGGNGGSGSGGSGSGGSGSSGSSGAGSTRVTQVITSVLAAGAKVRLGTVLYTVQSRPVVAMAGTLPAWRSLSYGVTDGPDVAQLELSLLALGYDRDHTMTVDEHFDANTKAAVERWQAGYGLDVTGTVTLGSVVFLPSPTTVASVSVSVGSAVGDGDSIMSLAASTQQVVITVPTGDESVVVPGLKVGIGDITGTVTLLRSATSNGATMVEAVITPQATIPNVDNGATVKVHITSDSMPNVLLVPAAALVSRIDGNYAVQVLAADGTTSWHTVEVLGISNGDVAVRGDGITAGLQVLQPL